MFPPFIFIYLKLEFAEQEILACVCACARANISCLANSSFRYTEIKGGIIHSKLRCKHSYIHLYATWTMQHYYHWSLKNTNCHFCRNEMFRKLAELYGTSHISFAVSSHSLRACWWTRQIMHSQAGSRGFHLVNQTLISEWERSNYFSRVQQTSVKGLKTLNA